MTSICTETPPIAEKHQPLPLTAIPCTYCLDGNGFLCRCGRPIGRCSCPSFLVAPCLHCSAGRAEAIKARTVEAFAWVVKPKSPAKRSRRKLFDSPMEWTP